MEPSSTQPVASYCHITEQRRQPAVLKLQPQYVFRVYHGLSVYFTKCHKQQFLSHVGLVHAWFARQNHCDILCLHHTTSVQKKKLESSGPQHAAPHTRIKQQQNHATTIA